jgi:hypothetical protein
MIRDGWICGLLEGEKLVVSKPMRSATTQFDKNEILAEKIDGCIYLNELKEEMGRTKIQSPFEVKNICNITLHHKCEEVIDN